MHIQVLIFSQFKVMLNILEKLLQFKGYLYERLDGSLRGNVRQVAYPYLISGFCPRLWLCG